MFNFIILYKCIFYYMPRGHIIDSDRLRLLLLRSNVSVNIVDRSKGRRVKSNTLRRSDPEFLDLLYLPFLRPSTRPSILFYTYDFGVRPCPRPSKLIFIVTRYDPSRMASSFSSLPLLSINRHTTNAQ